MLAAGTLPEADKTASASPMAAPKGSNQPADVSRRFESGIEAPTKSGTPSWTRTAIGCGVTSAEVKQRGY